MQGIDFNTLKNNGKQLSPTVLYGQSKLANILYARELAQRYPQLKVSAVVVSINLTQTIKGVLLV